jgi:hypothetical protein
LTTPQWWVAEEKRPSSAAFRFPEFSVDVASLAGSPEFTLAHLPKGSGLVSFNCGQARALGFDARLEFDPNYPENKAHANVYSRHASSQRKRMAQKLVSLCTVVAEPSFA